MLPAALARLQKADAQYLVSFRTPCQFLDCLRGPNTLEKVRTIPNEVRTHSYRDQRVSNEVRTRSEHGPNTDSELCRSRDRGGVVIMVVIALEWQPLFSTASQQTREKGLET